MKTTEIASYISTWLSDYLQTSGLKGFVIGISGGIDSAVAATLAAQTTHPLLCLEMPIHQDKEQVNRAQQHIQWLKDRYPNVVGKSVNLSATFDAFCLEVEPATDELYNLALANTRSRLRMSSLYYYATLRHALVVGTGNKIEDFGVGFYTKYGDGGVDISPIADLMKSEIYLLAQSLNIIPSIQQAQPTDGLWIDNRTDEDQIGASYDELEWAMQVYPTHQAVDFEGRQRQVFEIFKDFHQKAQHKINPIPICEIPEAYR